jgi:hypothetical protein
MGIDEFFTQGELKMRDVTKQSEAVLELRDGGDSCHAQAAVREGGVPLEAAEDYRRAVQALRDVRHMLPPDGIAIVDVILEGQNGWTDARRYDSREALPEFGNLPEEGPASSPFKLFEYDSGQSNVELEATLLERILRH